MITNRQHKALKDELWQYFQVLKQDRVISKYSFNQADCKLLTERLINAVDQVDLEDHNSYEESLEERKCNHDRE